MKIAFLIHPYSLSIVRKNLLDFYPFLKPFKSLIRFIPDYLLKVRYSNLPAHKFLVLEQIPFGDGTHIHFIGIMIPFFPENFILSEEMALQKIKSGVKLAIKNGAKIVGLGGFTSIVGNQGMDIHKSVNIPITSGNTLTAALCIEGITRACSRLSLEPGGLNLCIIGATGDIGSASARALSKYFKRIILCSRKISNEDAITKELRLQFPNKISVATDFSFALKESDVVLLATSAPGVIIDPVDLKSGSIVCDVALPHNISRDIRNKRKDVFVFDGGMATAPAFSLIKDPKWKALFPHNAIFGCLAELFLLALGNMPVNFSIGRGNITQSKIDDILRLFKKFNFDLADFSCGDYTYSKNDIDSLRNN